METFDRIAIPVVTDGEETQSQKAILKDFHYYIIHQQRFQNSQGKPFALACIYPQSIYIGYYYETLDEAMFIAQLCEWHARRGDKNAQECILDNCHFGNIQSKQAYDLLLNCGHPELAVKPYTLEIWGKCGKSDELFFQPTLEQISEEIIGRGKDWRDLWITHLPPDPLHLIQMEVEASRPTIDWTATIVRTAATVAIRYADGHWWSHLSDIQRLLRYQQIPLSDHLLKAHLAIWIWEHPVEVAFGESRSAYADYDDSLFCWKSPSLLSTLKVVVPDCVSCGKPRLLGYRCLGFSYYADTYVSKECPFDGYGCQREEGEHCLRCCHCSAIMQKAGEKAPRHEIETEIVRQRGLFAMQGGPLLRFDNHDTRDQQPVGFEFPTLDFIICAKCARTCPQTLRETVETVTGVSHPKTFLVVALERFAIYDSDPVVDLLNCDLIGCQKPLLINSSQETPDE